MKIKHLAKHEVAELDMLCLSFQQEIEASVSKLKDERFQFYKLPKNEQYRMLRLRVWIERYQVDLDYIISNLLPFWQQWILKRSKTRTGQGLGVRISTLTGKKSEQMLKSFIERDFPSEQNKVLRRNYLQNQIINKEMETTEDGIKTQSDKSKTLFDFLNPKGYLQYYKRRIRRQQGRRYDLIQDMKKRPYRTNPFI